MKLQSLACALIGVAAPAFAQQQIPAPVEDQLSPYCAPSTPSCTVTFAPFMLGGDPQQQARAGMDGRLAQLEIGLDGPAGALVRVAVRTGSVLAPGPVVWEDLYVKSAPGEEYPVFDVTAADLLLRAGDTFVIEFGRDPQAATQTLATLFGNVSFPWEPPQYPEPFFVNGQPVCAQGPFGICTTRAAFRTWMIPTEARYCLGPPTSVGNFATLHALGTTRLSDGPLPMRAFGLTGNAGALVVAAAPSPIAPLGGGRCIGTPYTLLGAFPVANGVMSTSLDPGALPAPLTVTAGDTLYLQAFSRDPGSVSGYALTDALALLFIP